MEGTPRTAVSLFLTIVIVAGALLGLPHLLGTLSSTGSTTGVTQGTNGIDFANPVPAVPGSADGARATWPPVPADASRKPLGRPPASRSSSTDYAFMEQMAGSASAPVSWDPCRPIHLVVNSADAPFEADRLLTEAASEVSRATGLQFVIEGPTNEPPSTDRQSTDPVRYGNRWSPVLVAWTNPQVDPRLKGDVAGLAGPDGAPFTRSADQHWISGSVHLDGPDFRDVLTQSDGWAQARAITMHELAHLVGLTHVEKRDELMAPKAGERTTFGDGDLEGLRQLGVGRCFTS